MALILILGAILIITIFAFLAYIIIKLWISLIKSMEEYDKKAIRKTKKEGISFLYSLMSKDYDADRNNGVAAIAIIFSVLCVGVLFIWFSVGSSFLK